MASTATGRDGRAACGTSSAPPAAVAPTRASRNTPGRVARPLGRRDQSRVARAAPTASCRGGGTRTACANGIRRRRATLVAGSAVPATLDVPSASARSAFAAATPSACSAVTPSACSTAAPVGPSVFPAFSAGSRRGRGTGVDFGRLPWPSGGAAGRRGRTVDLSSPSTTRRVSPMPARASGPVVPCWHAPVRVPLPRLRRHLRGQPADGRGRPARVLPAGTRRHGPAPLHRRGHRSGWQRPGRWGVRSRRRWLLRRWLRLLTAGRPRPGGRPRTLPVTRSGGTLGRHVPGRSHDA